MARVAMKFPKFLEPFLDWFFIKVISPISWETLKYILKGRKFDLTPAQYREVLQIWKSMNTITLTRRKSHLTTYLIQIGHFILTGKWDMYWAHALFNDGIWAVEAIGKGVVVNGPREVLNVDGVAILIPKNVHLVSWQMILDEARRHVIDGTEYDNLFDVMNDKKVSCIELIYDSLKEVENHRELWPNFFKLVETKGNITPQMIYDCGDFEVVYEVRN
jgi:hypothetical protein